MKRLTLEIAEYEGPTKWRWRLLQEGGAFVTDHLVELDRSAAEYDGFVNLYAFVRLNATTGVATASEEALIARVAEWVRRQVWGPIGDELASAAADEPLTVLVRIPEGAEELLFRPFELPFVESNPGLDLSLVFAHERDDPPTGTESVVEDSLRMLAIFSAPTDQVALNTRYERHELRRLIARVAQAGGRAIELRILQYGVTRQQLDEVLDGGNGWDLIHFSGHGLPAGLILEKEDGSTDLVHSHEFTSLLRPTRERLKLVTLSSCESGAVAAANTMQLLGIDEGEEAERPDPALEQRVALPAIAQELSGELDCAVMAMRYPVEDEFAIGLASELYSGLLERGQSLPRALQRALREAESVHSGRLSLATPALFGVHSASLRLEPPRVAPTEFDALAPKLAYFEPEPNHFVGRIGPLARASAALAPKSDRRGVVFHGMAGAGKTACALELAYRYEDSRFEAMAWHKAPSENQDIGEALARFAVDLEIQLPGLQIAHVIDDVEQLKQFLPRLKALLRERSLLIVLDNVESLLTNDGQWRDERWHHLVEALIGHDGLSRLVLTTRVPPHDLLGREDILIEPINSLSAGESALLARQLPNLGKLLSRESDIEVERGRDLVRRTVEIVQGNPKLIELADRQATDADALEARIAEANRAWAQGTNLGAFFETGEPDRSIEAEDFLRVLHSWTDAISDTLSDELRLAFQLLCCLEERDRHWGAIQIAWGPLWAGLTGSDEPADFRAMLASLAAQGLIDVELDGPLERYRIHPAIEEAERETIDPAISENSDRALSAFWGSLFKRGLDRNDTTLAGIAGLSCAPYRLREGQVENVVLMLERVVTQDSNANTIATALSQLHQALEIAETATERRRVRMAMLRARLSQRSHDHLIPEIEELIDLAREDKDFIGISVLRGSLFNELMRTGQHGAAKAMLEDPPEAGVEAERGEWSRIADEGRRLHVMLVLSEYEEVLIEAEELLQRVDGTEAEETGVVMMPWNVRETILGIAGAAARELGLWEMSLICNAAVRESEVEREAPLVERAKTDFNDIALLIALQRIEDAERTLRRVKLIAEEAREPYLLARTLNAWAELESTKGRVDSAAAFSRSALRANYLVAEPGMIALCHHNLASYLLSANGDREEIIAHKMADALIFRQTESLDHVRKVDELRQTLQFCEGEGMPDSYEELCERLERTAGISLPKLLVRLFNTTEDGSAAFAAIVAEL